MLQSNTDLHVVITIGCRNLRPIWCAEGWTSSLRQGASLKPPHGMMPCCLDLEMKWGHVINQANFHKVVRVVARFRAMLVCAIKDTRESIHGLQEGRHAEVVK